MLGLNDKNAVLKPLKPGSLVVAGTLLGRIGKPDPAKAPHVNFQLRPAGKGAPSIDPKPILDGWKLLESTNIYGPHGKNALTANLSIGQILLLSKSMLEKRVLGDSRVIIYSGGQNDIKTHQIDRRGSRPNPWEALARAIVGQQLSTKAAASIWSKLADQFGGRTPEHPIGRR